MAKLIQQGHQVSVISPVDEYITYKESFPELNHYDIKHLDRDGTSVVGDLALFFELRHLYKKIRPDFVLHYTHKPNIYGSIACGLLGIPSAYVITGLGYTFIHKGLLIRVLKGMYRFAGFFSDAGIFENPDDKELFVKQGLLSANKAYHVNGCGVDVEYFKPIAIENNNQRTVITFIGRLLVDKGINEFIEAARRIKIAIKKPVDFVVIGDFDAENPASIDRNKLLSWINEGLIDYKGFVKDVRPYIENSDCIVLPSYREGLPRIVIEGMAMAKPIITTDTPGCRQTVENEKTGFLVQMANSESLFKGMKSFLNLDRNQRFQMGVKGRLKCEREFADHIVADQLYAIIADQLGVALTSKKDKKENVR